METLTQETKDGMTTTQRLSELIKELGKINCDVGEEITGDYFKSDRYRKRLEEKATYYNLQVGTLTGCNCTKCKNKGVVMYITEDLQEVCKTCECMALRECIDNMKSCGIDAKVLKECTFSKFNVSEQWQEQIKTVAERYVETIKSGDTEHWLLLSGQTGAGKTHLSTAACVELMKAGKKVRYMMWHDIVHKLTQSKYNEEAYYKMLNELSEAEVLYIDDLFKSEKAEKGIAFEVINARIISRKPTIISSELGIDAISAIDPAIAGRIAQMATGFSCQIKNDDARNYRRGKH